MGALVAHARALALANSQAQDDFLEVIIMALKNCLTSHLLSLFASVLSSFYSRLLLSAHVVSIDEFEVYNTSAKYVRVQLVWLAEQLLARVKAVHKIKHCSANIPCIVVAGVGEDSKQNDRSRVDCKRSGLTPISYSISSLRETRNV